MLLEITLIGLFGLLGMTWIFPVTGRLVARTLARSRRPVMRPRLLRSPNDRLRLAILVPAHNERHVIRETLASISVAVDCARLRHPGLEARILVAADGCTDDTASVARLMGAEVIENNPGLGKWKAINALVNHADNADWIAFVDSGSVWTPELLDRCLDCLVDPRVAGIAPTYRNPSAGGLEGLSWKIESAFKGLEDGVGGPVSVHGATVLYRRKELVTALSYLGFEAESWLNDDVVVPLAIRFLYPEARIRYLPHAIVRDSEASHLTSSGTEIREFGRRRRMVVGNLQWIRKLLPLGARRNPLAAYLALRRVFRVFWAWWAIGLFTPITILVLREFPILAAVGAVLMIFAARRFKRPVMGLLDAATASVLAPWILFSASATRWK